MGRQKDSEARWTKKNNEVHYGWKNHVKTDLKTKLIIQAATTAASVHDSQVFEELLDGKDQAVLADSAYHSAEHEECLIKLNAQDFLMRQTTRSAGCVCGWSMSLRGWRKWGPTCAAASG